MLFLAQIVLSRVTRALIFCEGAAQRINKQNGVRNHLRKSISVIIPSSEFEATLRIISLTITLNMRTVNIILIMLFTVMREFLTNPFAKRCRAMNIPFGKTKNKEEEE